MGINLSKDRSTVREKDLKQKEEGFTTTEVSIWLVLGLTIFLLGTEFSLAFKKQDILDIAAREAGWYYSISGQSWTGVQEGRKVLSLAGMDPDKATFHLYQQGNSRVAEVVWPHRIYVPFMGDQVNRNHNIRGVAIFPSAN